MFIKYIGTFTDTFTLDSSVVCVFLVTLIVGLLILKTVTISKRYPPGPWGVPIFGHLPFFGTDPIKIFAKWQKRYGNVFMIKLGSWDTVVINGYEAIKEAADKPDDVFSSRPNFVSNQIYKEVCGHNTIAFAPFSQEYVEHKKITLAALRMFMVRPGNATERITIQEAIYLVTSLLSKDYTQPLDIKCELQYASGSIIYQILYGLGKKINIQKELQVFIENNNEFTEFLSNGNPVDVLPWLRYIMPWKVKLFRKINEDSARIREEQVKDHIETFSNKNIRDITDALIASDICENGDNDKSSTRLTCSQMVATLLDLQGAGFATTTITLQWLILYMAKYPEIQRLVQNEIDDVIGSGRSVKLTDRKSLVFTDATVHEVMRITAIVPMGLPKYTTKDTSLTRYDIDKGTVVFFNLHSSSHDKEFWGDPEIFRPSRLITENNKLDITKCNRFYPFGIGRRRCIAEHLIKLQMFLVFVTIMQRCSIVKPEGPEFDIDPVPGLSYSPKAFKVIVQER